LWLQSKSLSALQLMMPAGSCHRRLLATDNARSFVRVLMLSGSWCSCETQKQGKERQLSNVQYGGIADHCW
jgi:hypothetical protein